MIKRYYSILIKQKHLIHLIKKKYIFGEKSDNKQKYLIFIKYIDQKKKLSKKKNKSKTKMVFLLLEYQVQEKQLSFSKWLVLNSEKSQKINIIKSFKQKIKSLLNNSKLAPEVYLVQNNLEFQFLNLNIPMAKKQY